MNPWITLTIIMAAIIFGIDFFLEEKNGTTIQPKKKSVC